MMVMRVMVRQQKNYRGQDDHPIFDYHAIYSKSKFILSHMFAIYKCLTVITICGYVSVT